MDDLVKIENNNAFTTTLIIAEGANIEHRAVMQLIKKHSKTKTFASFEMCLLKTKRRPIEYAKLSESQATFLVMLMRNSEIVISFKENLKDSFFKMRDQLSRIASQQTNQQWVENRASGKIDRRVETDVIQAFIEYAKKQGGSEKGCNMYYANLSTMENKALFFIEQKYKNLRDILDTTDLLTIQQADRIVAKALQDGMDDNLNYKDIYKLSKKRVEMFAELRGKSALNYLSCDTKELR